MKACLNCQELNPPKARFCRECGKALHSGSGNGETSVESECVGSGPPAESTPEAPSETVPPESLPSDIPSPGEPDFAEDSFTANTTEEEDLAADAGTPLHLAREQTWKSEPCLVALAMTFPHILVAGYPSCVELQLTNLGSSPLRDLNLALDSRTLAAPASVEVPALAPDEVVQRLVEIDPAAPGNSLLHCHLTYQNTEGRNEGFLGARALRINTDPGSGNVVINIHDIQSNSGEGANAALGAEYGDVSISNILGENKIVTLNDLLAITLPEDFQPLVLAPSDGLPTMPRIAIAGAGPTVAVGPTRAPRLTIPRAFSSTVDPGCVLWLDAESEHARPQQLKLVSRPNFRIGKSSVKADLLTHFHPRNAENDDRTRRISSLHLELEATPEGIFLRDLGSTNGSVWQGGQLDGKSVSLEQEGLAMLAGSYLLEIRHHPSARTGDWKLKRERSWNGPPDHPLPQPGAIGFSPRKTGAAPYHAVWLLSDAMIGNDPRLAIPMQAPGIPPEAARLHRHRGCFWIEPLPQGDLEIDSVRISAGEIAPLATGMRVTMGETIFRIRVDEKM